MDKPEKLATVGTKDEDNQNIKHNTLCTRMHICKLRTI